MKIIKKTTIALFSCFLSLIILASSQDESNDNNLIYCCSITYKVRFKFSCCNKDKVRDYENKLDIKKCLKSQKYEEKRSWFNDYYLSNQCHNLILAVKGCQLDLSQDKGNCFKKDFFKNESILDEDLICSDVVICGTSSDRNFIIDQCGNRPLLSSIELESSFTNSGLCW